MTRGAAFALLLLGACGRPASDLLSEGSTASDGRFGVRAGDLFVSRRGPGVLFGTRRAPGAAEGYSYVILLEGARADVSPRAKQVTAANPDGATSSCALAFERSALSVDYAVGPSGEKLSVNGAAVDPAQGRLFLYQGEDGGAGAPPGRASGIHAGTGSPDASRGASGRAGVTRSARKALCSRN